MKRGFTLVELMVVITISMILMGGATVSVSKYFASDRLTAAGVDLLSFLNSARNLAVTNQKPGGFGGLDYVAVTLTADGTAKSFPVNNVTGIGSSYTTKVFSSKGVHYTAINFGTLLFAAGSGKLLGKTADPSYVGYPLPSNSRVGITISSDEVSETRHLIINAYGAIDSYKL